MNKKNILITGRPGVGKTTLVQHLYNQLSEFQIAGFFTSEIREKGIRQGFYISTFNGHNRILAHKNFPSLHRLGSYNVDIPVLEAVISLLKNQKPVPDIWLIDEIGKMESLSPEFRQFIEQLLNSSIPFSATISISAAGWIEQIRQRTDVQLFNVNESNRDHLYFKIADLLAGIVYEKNQK
jgi:nucleoside-triphosphatase